LIQAQDPASSKRATPGAPWGLVTAIGYGGLGFGIGVGLAIAPLKEEQDLEAYAERALAFVPAATIVGLGVGAAIGRSASARLARSEPLSPMHRGAVITGSTLAGGTLGVLVAAVMISGDGSGTPIGSDEQAVTICAGTGTVLGLLYGQSRLARAHARTMEATPLLGGGRYGVRFVIRQGKP
jgi:hypothetical protein